MKPTFVFCFLAGSLVLLMRTSTEAAKLYLEVAEVEVADSNLQDVMKDDEEDAEYAEKNALAGLDLKEENDDDEDEDEAYKEGDVENYNRGEEGEGEEDDDEEDDDDDDDDEAVEGVEAAVDDTPMNKVESNPKVFAETMEYV